MFEDFQVVQGLEIDEDQKDRQQEPGVADPVDHKRLGRGLSRGDLIEVVPDQEIGAEADPFPADEKHQEIISHDEQQHGDHEQIHVHEEAGKSVFSVHVPDGVDVNQKSDPRHHHQHHGGQRIDQKSEIDVQVAAENP